MCDDMAEAELLQRACVHVWSLGVEAAGDGLGLVETCTKCGAVDYEGSALDRSSILGGSGS